LQKSYLISILIIGVLLFSCKTRKPNIRGPEKNDFEIAFEYIKKDKTFSDQLKSYYPDLTNCDSLTYNYRTRIEPISTDDFSIGILENSTLVSNINGFKDLSEADQIKAFDSVYGFSEFYIKSSQSINTNGCRISLTFSKRISDLLPIKFQIVDEAVDPDINYRPRKGLYILTYDNANQIKDSSYFLLSN